MSDLVRIFISGDFCSTPSTEHIKVSESLKNLIKSCDISICNLESPILPPGRKSVSGRIYQSENVPEFLSETGFNVITLANNHAFDYGDEGYSYTVSLLKNGGIQFLGAGSIEEAYRLKLIDVRGLKIGLLAFSFAGRTGKIDELMDSRMGIAYINSNKVPHVIEESKKKVDFLIVLPHDGVEYVNIPMPETILRYRDFIDSGADIVIGGHPHCPQGWEIYNNKPIFYSLGNFFFNSKPTTDYVTEKPYWYNGLSLVLTIDRNALDYELICTRNIQNRYLEIDDAAKTKEHLNLLNALLNDKSKYKAELERVVESEGSQRMRNMAVYYRSITLKFGFRLLVTNIVRALCEGFYNNEQSTYLSGDTERSLILRYLHSQEHKN